MFNSIKKNIYQKSSKVLTTERLVVQRSLVPTSLTDTDHMLASLCGRAESLSITTMETRQSEVELLMLLFALVMVMMRSSTQPADRRASASWSQHSSTVSHSWANP